MCVWERERERDRVSLILYVCEPLQGPLAKNAASKCAVGREISITSCVSINPLELHSAYPDRSLDTPANLSCTLLKSLKY